MKILMIACSRGAYQKMQTCAKKWIEKEPETEIICKVKCSSLQDISMKQSVSECVAEWFGKTEAVVFFSATGIAVRSIAPCLQHKSVDPAVVVVDEMGKYSISLLSGHTGGANELAEKIASLLDAVPVITTATDREGKFAVDDFARKHGLAVTDWQLAKKISAAVLEGEHIGLCVDDGCYDLADINFSGELLPEVHFYKENNIKKQEQKGIQISYFQLLQPLFPVTLQLIPKIFVIGIGCRKGTPEKKIDETIRQCLIEENIRIEAVYAVASIDIKKQEKGILAYCEKAGLPFLTYSAEELQSVEGTYSESAFVEQITGVSNVCERSAIAATGGEIVCRKKVYGGVTAAIARFLQT